MSIATLSSVIAKFGRGGQHAEVLKEAIAVGTFIGANRYVVTSEFNVDRTEILHRGRFTNDPPFALWGAMFGDAINCHRTALDHLAWHLTCSHSGTPPAEPIPRNSPWRGVSFPIVRGDGSHWESVAAEKLWGVDPAAIAVFKSLQPFVTHHANPDLAPLAVLDSLWNMDKHRQIHFTDLTIWPAEVRLMWKGTETEIRTRDVRKWADKYRPGTGDEGTPLVHQRVLDPITDDRLPEVEVDHSMTADISLPEGPPAFGATVLFLLVEQNAAVKEVIKAFHPHYFPDSDTTSWDEVERLTKECAPPPSRIPTGPPENRGDPAP